MDINKDDLFAIDPDVNHFTSEINFESHSSVSFSNKNDIDPNDLKITHHNAQSLMKPGRIDEYEIYFESLKISFDILVFTETWVTPNNIEQCQFNGYRSVHLIRNADINLDLKNSGGGVSIFIRNNLEYKNRDELSIMLPFMECVFIEITFNNQNYLIGGIYRVPNTSTSDFIEHFNNVIEPIRTTHNVVLLGDYNIDLLKDETNKRNFEIFLQSNYLIPTILSATRVASKIQNGQQVVSETLIDNIFVNHNMNYKSGIIESSITDHYSIYIFISQISKPRPIIDTIEYRIINAYKIRTFHFYLNQLGISTVLDDYNAETASQKFFDTLNLSYEKSFPIKSKTVKERKNKKPWVSDDLIREMEIRDKLGRAANKNRIERKIFTDYRNELTSKLRNAKTEYFRHKFDEHANDIKKTWEIINSVIKSKNCRSKISLTDDDGKTHEESKVADTFINYFTNIAQKLSTQVPKTQSTAASFLKNRIDNTFTISPISPIEVDTVIDDLKSNDHNVNKIATTVLSESKHILTPILCHLINLFVQQGYFPENLKLGCITPIFKGGDKGKVNNYRPVCSLSPFSKIIEKVVNNRMVDFLEIFNIFSKTQFGFRKNMGTETALLYYIENLQKALNDKKYSISIFMDLSKAFDVIDHKILGSKLEHYGFRGKFLEFLLNFIKDREYFVHANGSNSNTKVVNIGVPQGSTLGPLLFLIYINDMINCSDIFFLSQFADDSTVTYSSSNLNNTISKIENEFRHILNWLSANKLIINLTKTNLMLFTNRPRPFSISISANGQLIEEVEKTKFLGVILDNKLKWNAHIDYITRKISKSVSILKMVKYTFPGDILKTLYYTLIYPYYTYCNIIWCSAANLHLEPLVKLQKKAIRIICKAGYLDHTDPLFSKLNLLKVQDIYDLSCAKFLYQCHNSNIYSYFLTKLKKNSDYHKYETRNRNKVRKPVSRLQQFDNSFIYNGVELWNKIPESVQNVANLQLFKIKIKILILDKKI